LKRKKKKRKKNLSDKFIDQPKKKGMEEMGLEEERKT